MRGIEGEDLGSIPGPNIYSIFLTVTRRFYAPRIKASTMRYHHPTTGSSLIQIQGAVKGKSMMHPPSVATQDQAWEWAQLMGLAQIQQCIPLFQIPNRPNLIIFSLFPLF